MRSTHHCSPGMSGRLIRIHILHCARPNEGASIWCVRRPDNRSMCSRKTKTAEYSLNACAVQRAICITAICAHFQHKQKRRIRKHQNKDDNHCSLFPSVCMVCVHMKMCACAHTNDIKRTWHTNTEHKQRLRKVAFINLANYTGSDSLNWKSYGVATLCFVYVSV